MPDYTDKPGFSFPGKPPKEALEFFRKKGLRVGFNFDEVWREEHAAAFTAAKATRLEVLQTLREAVDKALAEGKTYRQFVKELRPELKRLGWHGEGVEVADPRTGEVKKVLVGLARLKRIYSTNLRTARAAGQWDRIQRTKASHPYLLYQLGPSREHRPEHQAFNGLLLPADDPFWSTHYPPNGWGCKCWVRQISKVEHGRLSETPGIRQQAPDVSPVSVVNRRTGEVRQVHKGCDPGWDYNVGKTRRDLDAARHAMDGLGRAYSGDAARAWRQDQAHLLPRTSREYRAWAEGLSLGDTGRQYGGRRTIGVMSEATLQALGKLGVRPKSAGLSIEAREVRHLLAEARKGAKAVPAGHVLRLPELLGRPKAVLWDGTGRRPALLYVWEVEGESRLARVAVRLDHDQGRKDAVNAIRSAGMVDPANLRQQGITLLEGKI
ncbi:MAG: hypothetical protein LDL27_12615 [Desulfovibrio sp.]|nr:hypothetical protein [Desulfovibrio sp.]